METGNEAERVARIEIQDLVLHDPGTAFSGMSAERTPTALKKKSSSLSEKDLLKADYKH